jgi:hypothetical protein
MLQQGPAARGGGRDDLSFECTFCRDCVDTRLGGRCPNCGGNLVARPIRPANKLTKFPPSTERVFRPQGCGDAA